MWNPSTDWGQLSPAQLASLYGSEQPVTARQLELARLGWSAYRHPDPSRLLAYLREDLSGLPFLEAALRRLLADYPALEDGLSLTERWVLELVAGGEARPGRLFAAYMEREPAPFRGDWSLWLVLRDLCAGDQPLLRRRDGQPFVLPPAGPPGEVFLKQRLELTGEGDRVLAGGVDAVALHGTNRWLGGVHLQGRRVAWRWNGESLVGAPG